MLLFGAVVTSFSAGVVSFLVLWYPFQLLWYHTSIWQLWLKDLKHVIHLKILNPPIELMDHNYCKNVGSFRFGTPNCILATWFGFSCATSHFMTIYHWFHFSAETLKSAVLKDPLKSLIHRKWSSLPSLTTKTIDFQRFFALAWWKDWIIKK